MQGFSLGCRDFIPGDELCYVSRFDLKTQLFLYSEEVSSSKLLGLRTGILFRKLFYRVTPCFSDVAGLFLFRLPLANRVHHGNHARQRRLRL
jgi:hypothetical protein